MFANRDIESFYQKAAAYCAASEKCTFDVLKKLSDWEAPEDSREEIINRLKAEKFIDDERYTRAYVNDKFKYNKWGKVKIRYHLRHKNIPDGFIYNALDEIDETLYTSILEDLLNTKQKSVKAKSPYDKKVKLVRFASGRGFEPELIFKLLGDDMA